MESKKLYGSLYGALRERGQQITVWDSRREAILAAMVGIEQPPDIQPRKRGRPKGSRASKRQVDNSAVIPEGAPHA